MIRRLTTRLLQTAVFMAAAVWTGCAPQLGCDANQSGMQTCTDYHDSANNLAFASAHCSGLRGALRTDACPVANRVGTCAMAGMAGIRSTLNFYRPITPLAASTACTMVHGTFVETP